MVQVQHFSLPRNLGTISAWAVLNRKRRKSLQKWWLWPTLFLAPALVLIGVSFFVQTPAFFYAGFAIQALLCIWLVFWFLKRVFKTHKPWINRLTDIDVAFVLIFLCFCYEGFFSVAKNQSSLRPDMLFQESILALWVLFFWFGLRFLEGVYFVRTHQALDATKSWPIKAHPLHFAYRWQATMGCVSYAVFFCGLLLSTLQVVDLSPTLLGLACLVGFTPIFHWIALKLARKAEIAGLECQNFKTFLNLRHMQLLVFQNFGILSKQAPELEEVWMDAQHDITPQEIEDLLRFLATLSHPTSSVLKSKFGTKGPRMIEVTQVTERPNLGLEIEFLDVQRRRSQAILGGSTWHKILQNEVDPVGISKLKDWRSHQWNHLLLSVNRRIAAGFAWSAPMRPEVDYAFDWLKVLKRKSAVLSSLSFLPSECPPVAATEIFMDALPVERRSRFRYWRERETRLIEIRPAFDTSTDCQDFIAMTDDQQLSSADLCLRNAPLSSAAWLIAVSQRFVTQRSLGLAVLLLALIANVALVCFLQTEPALVAIITLGVYTIAFFSLFARFDPMNDGFLRRPSAK